MRKSDIFSRYEHMRENYPFRIAEMKKELGKKWENGRFMLFYLPFYTRQLISWVLGDMQRSGIDISSYLKDLEPLDRESEEFIKAHLDIYIKHVEGILQNRIEHFGITHHFSRDSFWTKVGGRTYIEELLKELGKYRDINKYREQVEKLDKEFKDRIPKAIEDKTYFPSDNEYTPKEYWWAHLEEVYGIPEKGPDDPF